VLASHLGSIHFSVFAAGRSLTLGLTEQKDFASARFLLMTRRRRV
jgi:hypothetical protein